MKIFSETNTLVPTMPPIGYLKKMDKYFRKYVFNCEECNKLVLLREYE